MPSLTPRRFALSLLLLQLGYLTISILRAPHWSSFLIGDCPYYAATAESLARDGDWDLRNQLPGDLKDHEGFFALAADGRIVPKHSTLLPILSVPFFLICGKAGFLVFNLLQSYLLIVGIVLLAGNTATGRLLGIIAYLSTPLLVYTFNYSPDVLGASFLIWAFVFAQRNRPIAAGVLVGLAVWAKIYLIVILLPLALIIVPLGRGATLRSFIGACLAIAPMLLINTLLFGAPWITGYDRDARITETGFIVTEHYSRFHQPFFQGLGNLLFDDRIGLLRTAPLWFFWPIGLWWSLSKGRTPQERRAALALLISLLLNLAFFARYDEWNASEFGNRFLFPALAIGFVLQGPMWEKFLNRPQQKT